MSSQRPNFFLSTFFASFRQQPTSSLTSAASQQPSVKHTSQATHGHNGPSSSAVARAVSSAANSNSAQPSSSSSPMGPSSPPPPSSSQAARSTGGVIGQFPGYHSPRGHHHPGGMGGIPIPSRPGGRRRGSDSSSEGFRDVLGAEKLYIGGRTATGEEKFFRLGVVRRVRSGDRLSLDRLSL